MRVRRETRSSTNRSRLKERMKDAFPGSAELKGLGLKRTYRA